MLVFPVLLALSIGASAPAGGLSSAGHQPELRGPELEGPALREAGTTDPGRPYDLERFWWQPIRTSGRHFRVVAHFPWDELLEGALETAEAAWPVAAALYGVPAEPPSRPYNLHLFRDRELFDRACLALTGRHWPRNDGLTDRRTGVALVLLGAGLRDEALLGGLGLTLGDRRLVAHEATHLFATYRVPGDAHHPAWLSEGVAEVVAREVVVQGGWASSAEQDPVGGRGRVRLQRLLDEGHLPEARALLAGSGEHGAGLDHYALSEALVSHLLHEHRGLWHEGLARVADGCDPEEVRGLLAGHFLGPDPARLEQGFRLHVGRRNVGWWSEGAGVTRRGDGWTLAATASGPGVLWSAAPVLRPRYSIAGRIGPGGGGEMRLLFGHRGGRHLALALGAGGAPGIALERFEGEERRVLASLALARPEEVDFRLEVDGRRIRVAVDGEEVLQVELEPGDDLPLGSWGLWSAAGCWGSWRGIRLD